jgi:hypothetical protein
MDIEGNPSLLDLIKDWSHERRLWLHWKIVEEDRPCYPGDSVIGYMVGADNCAPVSHYIFICPDKVETHNLEESVVHEFYAADPEFFEKFESELKIIHNRSRGSKHWCGVIL